MKKLKSSPGAQSITHFALKFSGYVSNVAEKRPKSKILNALNISVCNIIIQWKKLKSSPGAQSITHFTLIFSEYVSNVSEKRLKSKILNALNISVCNMIVQWKN